MEALAYMQEMEALGLRPTTPIFNHCMWAAERDGQQRVRTLTHNSDSE